MTWLSRRLLGFPVRDLRPIGLGLMTHMPG